MLIGVFAELFAALHVPVPFGKLFFCRTAWRSPAVKVLWTLFRSFLFTQQENSAVGSLLFAGAVYALHGSWRLEPTIHGFRIPGLQILKNGEPAQNCPEPAQSCDLLSAIAALTYRI